MEIAAKDAMHTTKRNQERNAVIIALKNQFNMYFQKRHNKYNAKSTIYNGKAYRSKLEASQAFELDIRKKTKEIKGWEYEKESIDLKVYGRTVAHYRPDFWVYHNDGSLEIVETKGFWTPDARIKWALLEAIYSKEHPEITLTVIK